MVLFSVAVEGDKQLQTYMQAARAMDGSGFYSLQFYEHIPYKPAWGLAFAVAPELRHLRVGPVTVPARLYSPLVNARFMALLQSIGPGAVLGISRGAYMGAERAGIGEVVEAVGSVADLVRQMAFFEPEIYVGTSGAKLVKAAAAVKAVKAIVVDNLANPAYVRTLKNIIEQTGRKDLKLIARPFTYIAENSDEAAAKLAGQLWKYLPDLVGPSPMVEAAGLRYEDLGSTDPDVVCRAVNAFALYGSVDDVLNQAARLVEAGADHICFGHPLSDDFVEGVLAVRDRVLPYFAGLG
jgi:5,10-methylenetetrahydromethanopterin reductase